MDIFDVLKAVSKRKIEFIRVGMNENDALKKAEFDISKEYHILLRDIRRLNRAGSYWFWTMRRTELENIKNKLEKREDK